MLKHIRITRFTLIVCGYTLSINRLRLHPSQTISRKKGCFVMFSSTLGTCNDYVQLHWEVFQIFFYVGSTELYFSVFLSKKTGHS